MASVDGDATRAALIRAAEQLMARRGIDGADLNDIQVAAGQRNRSAVHYHFKDRAGLIRAIGAKHRVVINAERHRRLDGLEAARSVSPAGLVAALVLPLAARLGDASGRDYIAILAQTAPRVGTSGAFRPTGEHLDSVTRLNAMLIEYLPGPRAAGELQIGQAIVVIPVLMADVAMGIERGELNATQVKRRVRAIESFLSGALGAVPDPG